MKRRQSGMTMIEVLGALAIATVLMVGLSTMIDTSLEDLEGQQAALYQAQVVGAARKYINANYLDLEADTAADPVAISISELKGQKFLPDGFSETNAYQQRICVLVHQPDPGKLDALIATYGGKRIPERVLPKVAMEAGQGGGYISFHNPELARGASWERNTGPYQDVPCNGATVLSGDADHDGGHLVSNLFFDGPGQLASDFLYRNEMPGRPELNQMRTPIKLAHKALVKSGEACGSDAALAMDSKTRHLLACGTDGRWRLASSWREPVATYADLLATPGEDDDVRMVTSLNRAFTYNGSGWTALAVDEKGDLLVPNHLTVGANATVGANLAVGANINAAGSIHAKDHISTDRDVNVGENLLVSGNARIGRSLTAIENITAEQMVYGHAGVEGRYVLGEQWVGGAEMTVWTRKNPGDECHIPVVLPDGRIEYIWPIGTFVLDANSVLIICGNDRRFRYQNTTFEP